MDASDPASHPGHESVPLAVVGAGAAGLTAAIFAGRAGVPARVFETRVRPGAKIRVSGGGRCNVLPSRSELEDFQTSGSSNALRKLLQSWPLDAVRAFFEDDLGVALKVEASGKVFPRSDDAKEIVTALLEATARSGSELWTGRRVVDCRPAPAGEPGFALVDEAGSEVRAGRVILATGGLSLPKTGSDGAGLRLARALGHELRPDYPALVPLTSDDPGWAELAGLALPVRLTVRRHTRVLEVREGDFLFTHRGYSGPVTLDVSWRLCEPEAAGAELHAHWIGRSRPEWDAWLRQGGKRGVAAALREELPRRLVARLLALAGLDPERRLSELTREERLRLVGVLDDCPLRVTGNEGYRTAEVTGGGVQLGEVVTRTLESRLAPGLHFAGEILDVTGRIGGFNFLWAWVSGRRAGEAAAAALLRPA